MFKFDYRFSHKAHIALNNWNRIQMGHSNKSHVVNFQMNIRK